MGQKNNEERSPIIVHLPHPGKEHIVEFNEEIAEQLWGSSNTENYKQKFDEKIKNEKETVFPWNNGEHRRKFIRVKGKYIKTIDDESGTDGMLCFWGEWEQPSIVTQIHGVTVDMKKRGYPSYIHEPRLGKLDKNCLDMYKRYNSKSNPKKGYQNTDPYVFGDSFYYSCCRQNDGNGKQLKELKRGDLIIFYGGGQNDDKKKIIRLDTVFVVDKKCFEYGRDEKGPYIEIEEDSQINRYHNDDIWKKISISKTYLNGVLNAIWFGNDAKENEYVSFVLYSGATKEHPVNEMFSYFICKTKEDGGDSGFPRMSYNVDNPLDNDFGFSFSLQSLKKRVDNKTILDYAICKTKNKDKDIQINNITDYWKRLTQDIVDKGYKLGISADEPQDKIPVNPQND